MRSGSQVHAGVVQEMNPNEIRDLEHEHYSSNEPKDTKGPQPMLAAVAQLTDSHSGITPNVFISRMKLNH